MTELEQIRDRLIKGYNNTEQMEEDISSLIILFDALKQSRTQLLIEFSDDLFELKHTSSSNIDELRDKIDKYLHNLK